MYMYHPRVLGGYPGVYVPLWACSREHAGYVPPWVCSREHAGYVPPGYIRRITLRKVVLLLWGNGDNSAQSGPPSMGEIGE